MTVEKIYRSLTKGEIGVYVGTDVDKTDGKISHILTVKHEDGTTEERHVADSTFKRWWKLVEETTPEDLEESVEQLNKLKDTVTKEEPTIEDLKQLNESGVELTEEELELFKQQAQQSVQKQVEVEKVPEKKEQKKKEFVGVCAYFLQLVESKENCQFQIYSEGREGVVKVNKKPVMFLGLLRDGSIRLYLKEDLDPVLGCTYPVEEKHSYPKQFPFRVHITHLDDNSKEILNNILLLHV